VQDHVRKHGGDKANEYKLFRMIWMPLELNWFKRRKNIR